MMPKLVRAAMLVLLGAGTLVLAIGCGGPDAEEVCNNFCDKLKECNPGVTVTCTCNPEGTSDCSNEDEILDKFDACTAKACAEFTTCLGEVPACTK